MGDINIEFDDPLGVFYAGRFVTGTVTLNAKKPISARLLKICATGLAHVHWRERYGDREIIYSANLTYLEGESLAWTSPDGTNTIPAGNHAFPFSVAIPPSCPPSFEGVVGFIRYQVHVELDRPWKFNKRSRKCFSVIPLYDLNAIPTAINPMVNSTSKNTGLLFKNGTVKMTVNLPKRGYVPGEILPITVDIDNGSSKPVSRVAAKIKQFSHFYVTMEQPEAVATGNPSFSSSRRQPPQRKNRTLTRIVAEGQRKLSIAPGTRDQVVLSIRIPSTVPSFECPIITAEYYVSVRIDTDASFGASLKCQFPLIIGTIPLYQMVVVDGVEPSEPPEYSLADPPSYEEAVGGSVKIPGDNEAFSPRYPVYNNLEASQQPSQSNVVKL